MISPDTPPGAEIICIDTSPGAYGPCPLSLGALYTVKEMVFSKTDGYGVVLHEVPVRLVWRGIIPHRLGWGLRRFRYPDLGGLDALLRVTRKQEEEELL